MIFNKTTDNFAGNPYPDRLPKAYLQFYLCATILANLLFLFWDGHWGDIGFWENWVQQLNTRGYDGFNGNYPPLYIHWLYLVGQFYNWLQIPVESNIFLKYLAQLPVMGFHLLLVVIVYQILAHSSRPIRHAHTVLLLTALNPAILFNGPIWGQIDVIPVIPICLALLASGSERYRLAVMPLYALGLLVKFQMIAFAPVFGIIFFRHMKVHLAGGMLALALIALAFVPYAVSGYAPKAFQLAYVNVVQLYGATTMGASNIWILLTGNAAPDHLILFGIDPESALAPLFKAKNFGILLFFLTCLMIFSKGLLDTFRGKIPSDGKPAVSELLFYATICAAAFFTFLPAMHERYLMPAVIVSLILYAVNPRKVIYPLLLTFISTYNLAMTLGLKTNHLWPIISWIMLATACYGLLELLLKDRWLDIIRRISGHLSRIRYLSVFLLVVAIPAMTYQLYQQTHIIEPVLQDNQRWLSEWPVRSARQDFGRMRMDANIHGRTLTTGNRRYARGIGTHAKSTIEFNLASKVSLLTGKVGLDDNVDSGSIRFSVWGDGKLLWESQPQYRTGAAEPFTVDLSGVNILRLYVDSLGSIRNDHANWLNMVLTLEE